MTRPCRFSSSVVAVAFGWSLALRADAPHVYAIKGARLVTVAGAPVATGTIVLKNGLIDAVGADVAASGRCRGDRRRRFDVYPGLIDMGNRVRTDITARCGAARRGSHVRRGGAVEARPGAAGRRHGRRSRQAGRARADEACAAGITTVLATPPGVLFSGHSALVNVVTPTESPIVGAIAPPRKGVSVVKSPVALHVQFQAARGDGYPESLLGGIAFVRQTFIDAEYQHMLETHSASRRPDRRGRRSTRHWIALRHARRADDVAVARARRVRSKPRARGRARARHGEGIQAVADHHWRPGGGSGRRGSQGGRRTGHLQPQLSDEVALARPRCRRAVRELRLRAHAPKVPAGLSKAGVPFAFSSSGLTSTSDFVKNAARAVKEGLPADAAVRALTLDAARIAGVADRLGSLEKGKIANVIMTDGDLFAEHTTIKLVLIDGQRVNFDAAETPKGRGRGGL